MSTDVEPPMEDSAAPPAEPEGKPKPWITVAVVVLGLLLAYVLYAQHRTERELSEQLDHLNAQLNKLQTQAEGLSDDYANLKGQLDVTSEKLGLTQTELSRAHALANQLKEEQRRTASQLGSQLEQQQARLGSLTGEVSEVKGNVEQTQAQLAETESKLQSTIGDLGVQSGLIARNHDEVQELKRRGERDYFEFKIQKSKQFTRVGMISVRLNKTDTKRQRFTITLLDSDKTIEKKDKTLLEPVQFYLQGTRSLLELVVYQIDKNRITGYLSAPKDLATKR